MKLTVKSIKTEKVIETELVEMTVKPRNNKYSNFF